MTFIFDRETALIAQDDGQFTIEASDVYRNPTGMAFGGWVAAVAAKAVEMHPECRGPLVSQQIIYMTGVGPGEVKLSVTLLRAGSSTQFWRVELSQNGSLTNAADIVTSTRRPTDIDYQVEMPEARSPEDSVSLPSVNPMAPAWVTHYDQRIAKGRPSTILPKRSSGSRKPMVARSTGSAFFRSSTRRCHGHFSSPNNSVQARPYPWPPIYMRARKIWRRPAAIT